MQSVGEADGRAHVLAPLLRQLEAEQERWFLWVPVFLGVGIGTYFWLPSEPGLFAALTPLAVALALWVSGPRSVFLGLVIGAFLAMALGFALAKVRVEWTRAPVLQKQIRAEVNGYLELIEPRPKGGHRLTLRVISIEGLDPQQSPKRVRITTRSSTDGLQPGDVISMLATLMPPSGPALPGGFDFGRQAWFDEIGAVGYAFAPPRRVRGAAAPPDDLKAWAAVERLRQAIGQRIRAALPGQSGAIANALITGERGGTSEETKTAFRDSGLIHVLSISGLHMVIMAGSVFFLVRLILAAFPALALNYPIKKWAAVAAMLGAFGYLMISGSSFATVRSAIMISIMFLAVLLDRPALALRNVAIAAIVILIVFPESLFNAGFQMSFAAVVALVATYEVFRRRGANVFLAHSGFSRLAYFFVGIVLSTLIASSAVAPFAAYHFHQSQQYAVLANLMAIPICNVIVMPAALAALIAMPLGLEALPLWVMGQGIDGMVWCAERVSGLPGAVGRIPAMPMIAFLLMVAGGLWLTLWQTRWRLLGLGFIAVGLALAPTLRLPDLLIGRDGGLVAARVDGDKFSAVGSRRPSFELIRWLQHDGDAREPKQATKAVGFDCDGIGCRTALKGVTLAVTRHPAAFVYDCERARIVVSRLPFPRGCSGPTAVIDFFAVRNNGTYAVYIEEDGTIRIENAREMRGLRPWSMPPQNSFRRRRVSALP